MVQNINESPNVPKSGSVNSRIPRSPHFFDNDDTSGGDGAVTRPSRSVSRSASTKERLHSTSSTEVVTAREASNLEKVLANDKSSDEPNTCVFTGISPNHSIRQSPSTPSESSDSETSTTAHSVKSPTLKVPEPKSSEPSQDVVTAFSPDDVELQKALDADKMNEERKKQPNIATQESEFIKSVERPEDQTQSSATE